MEPRSAETATVRAGHEVQVNAESWETVGDAIASGRDHYVAAVVHDGSRIALVRNSWSDGWVLPGGSIEAGESPAAAAEREVEEETGLRVDVAAAVARVEQRFVHGGATALGHLTVFDAPARSTDIGSDLGVAADEIREAAWFDTAPDRVDGLPEPLFERVVAAATGGLS
jgi:8-oxo-dGTP pyrophosphatase MutT (NUDIX family)